MSSSEQENSLRRNSSVTGSSKPSLYKTISKASLLKGKQPVIAARTHDIGDIPAPGGEGYVGSVPVEKLASQQRKSHLVSRKLNRVDTSLDPKYKELSTVSKTEIEQIKSELSEYRKDNLFPWDHVAEFFPSSASAPTAANSRAIKDFIIENFYNDWYFNSVLISCTCFYSWLLAYMGFSWFALIFIFICTATNYNFEYTRFNRNIRDDLKRTTVHETLSSKTETTLWLNSFLQKFWVIYMPVLSQQVFDQVNPILDESAPGYGIDALALEHFTLGSKAPSIRGVRTHTKGGKNFAEVEMAFAFTPNDESEMTPKEAKEKINPKISLGITLGKGFVSKTMSVIVENINVSGRIRLVAEFGDIFPNIKIVSVQLLEAPMMDFVLKPVGGDTLGLDVMSFLPGLKSFVKSMINSNIGPMLIAPNKMDIDVEDLLAAQSNDAIGMLAVKVTSASNLKSSERIGNSIDPYVVISTENEVQGNSTEVRTSVKSDVKNPRWNETKYILVNTLNQKLTLKCFDFNDVRKDTLIGSTEIDLKELLQEPIMESLSSELTLGTYTRGAIEYSLYWYPTIDTKAVPSESENVSSGLETDLEDEIEQTTNSDVGIAKITLQNIKELNTSIALGGIISPSAEFFIDGKLVKTYRTIKKNREPAWNETIEVFIPSMSSSKVQMKVFHNVSKSKKLLIASKTCAFEELLNISAVGTNYMSLDPQGIAFFTTQWKPLCVSDEFSVMKTYQKPIGSLIIEVSDTNIKTELQGVGDIDPFFTISINHKLSYKSKYVSDTKHAVFNENIYLPYNNKNQLVTIAVYDYQSVGKNRLIGSLQCTVGEIISSINVSGNSQNGPDFSEVNTWPLKSETNKLTGSTINLRFGHVPLTPVFTPDEAIQIKELKKSLDEKKEEFQKEQANFKLEMEKNPDYWEVDEIKDPFEDEEKIINAKNMLTLDQLLSSSSGMLNVEIVSGFIKKPNGYLQILFDDIYFPSITSAMAKNGKLANERGNAFIRDLEASKMYLRVSKKHIAKDTEDIITEARFNTIDILKKSYCKPLELNFEGCTISLKTIFEPASVKLPKCETIINTGYLNLNLISAKDLLAADRNGKSDPYVDVVVNGITVYTSKTVKKSLSPTWNERTKVPIPSRKFSEVKLDVYDWDRAGNNDPLGYVKLDLDNLEPGKVYNWDLPLSKQGTIQISAIFEPEYIKPTLDAKQSKLSTMPFKVVSNVAGAGAGVAGAGLGLGVGGIKGGGRLLKKGLGGDFGRRKSSDVESRSNSNNGLSPLEENETLPNGTYAPVPRNNYGETATQTPDNTGSNHTRTDSVVSSSARTLAPNGIYNGKIQIVAAENLGKHIDVKISLAQNSKLKRIFKSKPKKADAKGVVYINENCVFKSSPDATLIFNAVSHHTLAKDKDLGITKLNLSDPQISSTGNIGVKLGEGMIVVKIDYGDVNDISTVSETNQSPSTYQES
ncbi:hypothetical protein TPHA_0B00440 [Tetrapisispora phaffii CBS 4417]|uniref:Tricalbin n=1 Tax=Tetrapisispora phaffii (strain ATCC 24235 / CBS 4417 / NBRC 1672 / NRRL Y-8282 / UCD 70-5) TaxID=1071381 RepID=G8BQB8_TETPH|nr:hypothetical protein TPHA_0B00440 [Tetrapisispora phaffii CBS 4417]CCE61715.1 hypothetical protein TPHA_0B00440 [Tetrapisispora phaffii CBS 4417]